MLYMEKQKIQKTHTKTANIKKYWRGMMNLSYLMYMIYVIYSVSDIQDYFEIILKKTYGGKANNLSIRIYVNKIENRRTFEIKTGYYLELLTPETMKLLGSNKSRIT